MRARFMASMLAILLVAAGCSGDAFERDDRSPDSSRTERSTTSEAETSTSAAAVEPPHTAETPATAPTTALPGFPSPTMERIEASGTLRVGVFNRPFLPLVEPGEGTGFEPDLARELTDRLFAAVEVEFLPVTAAERFTALDDGSVDVLIRGTAHTRSREERAGFTAPYLLDGVVVVIDASGSATVTDLEGASIAVPAGTTLELDTSARLAAAGVSVDLVAAENARALFASGAVDGYARTWIAAVTDLYADPGLGAIWLGAVDPLAIAVPLGDPAFLEAVDETLREIIADGTWEALVARWFPTGVPWTIEEMLARPPSDR